MKTFQIITFVLFSLFGVSSVKGGVVITGKIKGNIPSKIEYTNPINNTCYLGFKDSVKPDLKGNFRIEVDINKPSFINLKFTNKTSGFLIIEPGKSYGVNLEDEKINISSPDSLGQKLIFSFPSPVIVQIEARKFRNDTSLTSVAEKVAAMKESDLAKLNQLFEEKQISRPFYDLAKKDRDCYYSTFMAIFPLTKLNREKPAAAITDFWGKIFQDNPPGDNSLMSSPYWNEYIQYYFYYKEFTDKDFSLQKMREYRDKGIVNTHKIELAERYLPQGAHEYYKAATIYFAAIQKDYEKELVNLYKDFETKYPGSGFSVYLKPLIEQIEVFQRAAANDFSKDVTFVSNYEKLNTLKDCIAPFQGKKIFIDIWATWCGPCKAEFAHKEALKQILKQKNIETLYISIDDEARAQAWKDMIKFYGLDGYHVRANKELTGDLRKIFDKNGIIAIPWYILVNENGEIVKKHAANPSNPQKLEKEIAEM